MFAYDYQGYGTSEGKPSESHVYEDVNAAYDYLVRTLHVEPSKIIAFGRSLGGGPATEIACRRPIAGLVLESSFTSALRIVTRFRILPFDRFDNLDKIKHLQCPVLVIHGTRDSVISISHGKRLFAAANDPKQFLWIEGANHNDVAFVGGKRYVEALQGFAAMIEKRHKASSASTQSP